MLTSWRSRWVLVCMALGFALGVAFGAVGDEPGRLVVCVVKPGEEGAICMPLEAFMEQFGSRVCYPTMPDAGVVSI